jgi:hypothetical protein
MTTLYQAISSQSYPEYMYFDGKCYRLLDDTRRTNTGLVVDQSSIESYTSCKECNETNPQNTMYVTYE